MKRDFTHSAIPAPIKMMLLSELNIRTYTVRTYFYVVLLYYDMYSYVLVTRGRRQSKHNIIANVVCVERVDQFATIKPWAVAGDSSKVVSYWKTFFLAQYDATKGNSRVV